MRPAIRRGLKYAKKVDGVVSKDRLEVLKDIQSSGYNISMVKQMELDTWIKSLHLGMNEVYYIIFAKQINKLIEKFRDDILEEEVSGKKDLWVARGLSSATLDEIMTRFNITPPAPPVDWLGSFNYRREVTVTNGGGALSAFQIKIELTALNFDFTHAESDGKDIRITKSDKLTKLDYWLESWDAVAQTAKIWVEADALAGSGNTSLYLYFGDNAVASESTFDNTFTKNYGESGLFGLWHMDDGVSPTADSSGEGNDGTVVGATWQGVDGGQWAGRSDVKFQTGDSLDFDGLDDYINCGNINIAGNIRTISAWIKTCGVNDHTGIFLQGGGYGLGFGYNSRLRFCGAIEDIASVNDCQWHFVVGTTDGTTQRIYVDGVEVANATYVYYPGINNVRIGDDSCCPNRHFDGAIDEVRIYNRTLTLEEVQAQYERRKYAFPEPTNAVGSEESKP